MTIAEAVTTRINQLLKEKNMTLYKLQQKSFLSRDTIKSIMKNKTKGVTLKTLVSLAEGFSISVSEFLDSQLFTFDNLM